MIPMEEHLHPRVTPTTDADLSRIGRDPSTIAAPTRWPAVLSAILAVYAFTAALATVTLLAGWQWALGVSVPPAAYAAYVISTRSR